MAPGSNEPDESVTVPRMVPLVICAAVGCIAELTSNRKKAADFRYEIRCFIKQLLLVYLGYYVSLYRSSQAIKF
jgi:hypothetical protein